MHHIQKMEFQILVKLVILCKLFFSIILGFQLVANGFVYGKLRVCVRGFSEGKSEASKRATDIGLGKTSNFLYTLLAIVFKI